MALHPVKGTVEDVILIWSRPKRLVKSSKDLWPDACQAVALKHLSLGADL